MKDIQRSHQFIMGDQTYELVICWSWLRDSYRVMLFRREAPMARELFSGPDHPAGYPHNNTEQAYAAAQEEFELLLTRLPGLVLEALL